MSIVLFVDALYICGASRRRRGALEAYTLNKIARGRAMGTGVTIRRHKVKKKKNEKKN
jgi:hypothetical protein